MSLTLSKCEGWINYSFIYYLYKDFNSFFPESIISKHVIKCSRHFFCQVYLHNLLMLWYWQLAAIITGDLTYWKTLLTGIHFNFTGRHSKNRCQTFLLSPNYINPSCKIKELSIYFKQQLNKIFTSLLQSYHKTCTHLLCPIFTRTCFSKHVLTLYSVVWNSLWSSVTNLGAIQP